jgi:hypothetical protein
MEYLPRNVRDSADDVNLPAPDDNGTFMDQVLHSALSLRRVIVCRFKSQEKVVGLTADKINDWSEHYFSVNLRRSQNRQGPNHFYLNIPGNYSRVAEEHWRLATKDDSDTEGVPMLDFDVHGVKASFMNCLEESERCVHYELWATAENFDVAARFVLDLIEAIVRLANS